MIPPPQKGGGNETRKAKNVLLDIIRGDFGRFSKIGC
jgi:hypothetical protein